jgi:hypothetical protein
MRRNRRPSLRVEIGNLGAVDPFRLSVVEHPPDSGRFHAENPDGGARIDLEAAGLNLVGASQALLALSVRWLGQSGRDLPAGVAGRPGGEFEPGLVPPVGEVRVALRRREARLLASLLRRHVGRLPEPPEWMPELQRSLEQIDAFLQWEEG